MSVRMDRREIERRLLLRLLGSPVTLIPLFGGGISALTPLFFNVEPGIPLFLGITGVVAAGVSVLIRLLVSRDKISREVLGELQQRASATQERALDDLHQRLARDRDERDERLLADLRTLVDQVSGDWSEQVNVVASADILRTIDQLFQGCVRSLERTLRLKEMADQMGTPEARHGLLQERERLLSEVRQSVIQLSSLVTQLRMLDMTSPTSGTDLAAIRDELDRSLAAAQATANEARTWAPESRPELRHGPIPNTKKITES